METSVLRASWGQPLTRRLIAITCAILLVRADPLLLARQAQQPAEQSVRIPPEQLDALVSPIALYPDPLLSQTLVASTYPLEIIQLQQWLEKNKGLDQKALTAAVAKQPWDPSIQAMAPLPDLVKQLADNIQWTTDLGNAVLAQQSDVMDAVQRMRTKAEGTGGLTSTQQQTVEHQVVDNKSVVVIEQADPQVVYVPSYDPVAVYGPAVYPYPPIYYPSYSTGGAIAAGAIAFGTGIAMGAAWGGGWGWGAGWGHGDIDMNFNNNFNRNANISGVNRTAGARNTWQHNSQHRGGAPYADRTTANRFGSNARGDSLASRQKGAQQQIARQKGNLGSVGGRAGAGNLGGVNRAGGAGNLGGVNRAGGAGNIGGANRAGGAGVGARSGVSGGSFGGGDRVGNRSVGGGSSVSSRGGFGGGSGGFSGSAARSSSSRGASSMGRSSGRSGGGRSGGGRSGGGRSGGGGRR